MPPYEGRYMPGDRVRVRSRADLEDFARLWRWHHPIQEHQLDAAGRVFEIEDVGYYHGGDPLYTLRGIAGEWHEDCLAAE